MKKYEKAVTVRLTKEDFEKLEKRADADRRTTGQYASILVEDALNKTNVGAHANVKAA